MNSYPNTVEVIGPFRGCISNAFRSPDLIDWLERIPALIHADGAEVLCAGRNLNVKMEAPCGGKSITVVVKAFGKPSLVKNAIDRTFRGSKAQRTWLGAVHLDEHGVGTPEPVAFLERWVERRLIESYFITIYQEGLSDFTAELGRLFRKDPQCYKFMALMQTVADSVRAMHDAGFLHNDLGNQNIMLRRGEDGESWSDVQFIDLNRGAIRAALSERERGRDISRIYLPSDLLRVFKEMYYCDVPPEGFQKWESRYRRRYARHAATRALRHPLRQYKKRHDPTKLPLYPSEKDMWIWDERSGQAQTILVSKDRAKYYAKTRVLNLLLPSLRSLIPVWIEYRSLLKRAFKNPVDMANTMGVAIEVLDGRLERQMELLGKLGKIPVMVRFYRHRSDEERELAYETVRRLHAEGYSVSIALVQDRLAVRNSGAWQVWAGEVLAAVGGLVELVEVCHAINRVKWGIWDRTEYQKLVKGVAAFRKRYPKIVFSGPAVIDFEYPYVMAALDSLPDDFKFDVLSHHLYVDRRGAPENRQGLFSSLEKFALGRAIANRSKRCGNRFIVSEVNWPLRGTGVYSPVGSPYVSPGVRHNDPSVSEDDYADYMLRYLLIAICSGLVERVYWWRLVAFGYGLVDDSNPEEWRERPAFIMLKNLLRWVRRSRFIKRIMLNKKGAQAFEFEKPDGVRFWLAYTSGSPLEIELPMTVAYANDAMGESIAVKDGKVELTGRVICLETE